MKAGPHTVVAAAAAAAADGGCGCGEDAPVQVSPNFSMKKRGRGEEGSLAESSVQDSQTLKVRLRLLCW